MSEAGWFRSFLLVGSAVALSVCAPAVEFRGQPAEDETVPVFSGTNWDGSPFDLEQLRGKITVVFFGYTYCPDICPFTLSKMKQVSKGLGDRAEELAVVFASVDPHRDTVEKLASYVPNFDKRFFGVHLTFPELEVAKEAFGVTVQYGQPKDGPGTDSFYYVDHTGTFFLLDRQGKVRVTFPPNAKIEDLKFDIEQLVAE